MNLGIHKNIHEGIEIETKVDRNSSTSWETQLQLIGIWYIYGCAYSDCFFLTGCVNWCPIHHLKTVESMNS